MGVTENIKQIVFMLLNFSLTTKSASKKAI